MSKAYIESTVTFNGDAGTLEGKLAVPMADTTINTVALICHPHPLYGGTMDNKVAYALSRATLANGLPSLRFNYRGVGNSEGTYNHGFGETDDVLSAMQWLNTKYPDTQIVLCGFSFGGAMAIQAALQLTNPIPLAALVTVAPPLMNYATEHASETVELPAPWLYVHSRDDDVVEFEPVHQWMRQRNSPPKIVAFKQAGHFFHGQLTMLKAVVTPFLNDLSLS